MLKKLIKPLTPLHYILFGFWLMGIVVGLWAPQNVLSQFPVAKAYSSAVTTIFPFVNRFALKSNFPEVTLLYHTLLLPSAPFFVVLTWRYLKTRKSGLLVRSRAEMRFVDYIALLFFALPFCLLMSFTSVFLYTGEDSRLVHLGTSRESLAFFGVIILWGGAFFATGAFASFKKVITGKL